MTDIYDRASDLEQAQRDDALSEQRTRAGLTGKTWMDSARECRVCDEPIPLKRRKAVPGCSTCIDCQNDLELALKGGNHPHP